jgi:RNA polymerase sigma factor (sigma-70 family)
VIRFASDASRIGALRSRRLLALASDDALVEQMRRGNEAAFEVAFERFGAGILGFCRHMLGSQEEAEDVVQHTFAAAFRELGRPDEREIVLKPWLYAVARNRCVSILRARRDQPAVPRPPSTIGLAEQVERRAEVQELLEDLLELPEDQRAALLLSQGGALSHAEVAEVVGCEPLQVKGLVFRARTALIQRRDARETPCASIREQLANLRGGALRRTELRHHLRECTACTAYAQAVRRQRRLLGAVLPVTPSLALKSSVLGGGATGGGLATAAAGGGMVAKLAAAGLITAGGAAVVADVERSSAPAAREARVSAPPQSASATAAHVGAPAVVTAGRVDGRVVVRDAGDRAAPKAGGRQTPRPDAARRERRAGSELAVDTKTHAAGPKASTPAGSKAAERAGGGKAAKPVSGPVRAEEAPARGPVTKPAAGTPVKRGPAATTAKPVAPPATVSLPEAVGETLPQVMPAVKPEKAKDK